jgi:hypothetical protein
MGTRIVSASLDDASYEIWKTLERRSAWLRRMLGLHALAEGVEFVNHWGTPHETWGFKKGDARCNPITKCPICWNTSQIRFYESLPQGRDRTKKEIKDGLEWRDTRGDEQDCPY